MSTLIPTRTTRMILGMTILLSHFGGMAYFVVFASSFLDWTQVLQGVLSLAPITSVYSVLFVRYCGHASTRLVSELPSNDPGFDLFAFLGVGLPIVLFPIALFGGLFVVLEFDSSLMPAFSAGLDTVFGAFLATVFAALFPDELFHERTGMGTYEARAEE
ncbi:MAG: hypothetical protein AAGK69_07175 [Pseudomonadota bacterium]